MGIPSLSELGRVQKTLIFIALALLVFHVIVMLSTREGSPKTENAILTPGERLWLDENAEKLTLYYNPDFPPIEFADENGEFIGLGADVTAAVEQRLGITFIKQPCSDWNLHLQSLAKGDCSVAPTIVRTDERESYAFFTVPYARVPVVIITTSNRTEAMNLDELGGMKIAVVSGFASENYVRESDNGSYDIHTMQNVPDALKAVAFGEMDVFVGNLAVAAYYSNLEGLSNLRVASTTDYSFEWSIGVSRDYPMLFSAVQKALNLISEDELTSLRSSWISMQPSRKLNPRLAQILRLGALFAVALVVSLLIATLYLKKRLNEKMKTLESAQETLLEQSYRLQHSEKMEALGTLSGGIAHDFNNILQVIEGYAILLLERNVGTEVDLSELEHIVGASKRAAALITKLMAFSRNIEFVKVATNINAEVTNAANILTHTIPRMVEIKLDLAENLDPVMADPIHLEQIIFNLSNNAVDAMPQGGTLLISTSLSVLESEISPETGERLLGPFVVLSLKDTGCGMSEELQAKIFDPFFTTKEQGKGTGLGLASVYGIVKSLGGIVKCTSEEGVGTTFHIVLPTAASVDSPLPVQQDLTRETAGKGETVLLVDDEPHIIQLSQEFLEMTGYTVHTAENGEMALEKFASLAKVDIVLLDLNMPGMGGYRCLQELLKLDPAVKVLIVSGHSEFDVNRDKLAESAMGIVRKPYHLIDLAQKIREVLSR